MRPFSHHTGRTLWFRERSEDDGSGGTPFVQVVLSLCWPIRFRERWEIVPFAEFFNLFPTGSPGANYVTEISALPNPVNDLNNAMLICTDPSCTATVC